MSAARSRRRLLAAPILGERGGGVGQVSALLWDSMRDNWTDTAEVLTLLGNGRAQAGAVDKIRFGLGVAGRQILTPPAWILFAHLGLARVERFVPSRLQAPYVVFLHGIEAWAPLSDSDRAILTRASLRIANSHFTARAVSAANPGLGDIAVCPLALPKGVAAVAPAREHARVDAPRHRTVLAVGRLDAGERYKGQEQLIRIWPAVVARVPDARLVIAGAGDDAARLKRLAAEGPVAPAIRFPGFLTRPGLDAEYAAAALFALPSRGEGFGLVYLEAMAHGLACIGSVVDAASEVIDAGRSGVLVDPDDEAALGRVIVDLLESPDRCRMLGEAGRARLAAGFLYQQFRDRLVSLLRRALPGESAAGAD